LTTAAVFGKTEIALALVNAGADVNIINNDGSTPLHTAAFFCHTVLGLKLDFEQLKTSRPVIAEMLKQ